VKLLIDADAQQVVVTDEQGRRELPLWSKEAFALVSRWWVKMGWANKFSYDFTWLGRPIIQLPEDLVRLQELVVEVEPTVVVETGIAHGGSTVFFASLLKLTGGRKVVSVDIEIRPHNRAALDAHFLRPMMTLIEASSIAPATVEKVKAELKPDDRVLVILDSNHTRAHVREELERYAPLVSPGSYIVATDGIMLDLHDVPGGRPEWKDDNPTRAAEDFVKEHPEFVLEERWTRSGVTYFPGAYLRRK
jgi:cephalosporin hydroxylase